MTDAEKRKKIQSFVKHWQNHGDEKSDTHFYWEELLSAYSENENKRRFVCEKKVIVGGKTKFIDVYIPETRVLIEQKSRDISLDKEALSSDNVFLTPYGQAKRYNDNLPLSEKARWIITCNFAELRIYDMESRSPESKCVCIKLEQLEDQYPLLEFLLDKSVDRVDPELTLSLRAGVLVGRIYDALLEQYIHPDDAESQRSLNELCVRLVFCMYAEDALLFGKYKRFEDYVRATPAPKLRTALMELFAVLNTPEEKRDAYLEPELAAFPYCNGGLFADRGIEIPIITEEIKKVILEAAHFDWSPISPTIFGAVFESTLNPVTRHEGGMHYTSVENIHKVIDPLFLDELREELEGIKALKTDATRSKRLREFQSKLAELRFLDPAAGSGNFLTETYLCLRRMENEIIELLNRGQVAMDGEDFDTVKVKISQFYGIEINDFAVTVAKTALWISESQMLRETLKLATVKEAFLPLKTQAQIVEGNALRMDWEEVVPKEKLSYIMGNPPFMGYSLQSEEQKKDILSVYVDEKGKPYKAAGKIDYVAGWYFKAAQYMQGTGIQTAFVSTNSITQGEQVATVWKPLFERFHIHIDFAYRSFVWNSEAADMAHVHCVIVGISEQKNTVKKRIYDIEKLENVENINPYLIDAPLVFIGSISKPICKIPEMKTGTRPADGGHLIIEANEYCDFIKKEPSAVKYIRRLMGSVEFINNKYRYCLWLVSASPAEIRKMPLVTERIEQCRIDRANAPDEGRRKLADKPSLFREINVPTDNYILVPCTSSERRKYIPIGFLKPDIIANNSALIIPNATLYHFGVLTSFVHMAWTRVTCGRLEMRYRYSKDIVYNNFPWPDPTPAQRSAIEQSAQAILNARAAHPDCSLADLYDPLTMPADLQAAHRQNDKAVLAAYGLPPKTSEPDCVAFLMRRYQALTQAPEKAPHETN